MKYFSDKTGINGKNIEVKRMTLRPLVDELSEELKELILENNQLDQKLYEHCL